PAVAAEIIALQGIARGSDGNLWAIGQAAGGQDQLVRVTSAGVFSLFPIPSKFSEASVITPGPDGNLWFFEDNGSRLAQATTSGIVTEYQLQISGFAAGGITAG